MALDDNELLMKQLPHSVEAEQAVLGSILFDPQCVPEVIDKLRPDDFYLRQNREIYETIYSMFNYSLTIDPVTVLENMKQHGYYTDQSRSYLLQLIDILPRRPMSKSTSISSRIRRCSAGWPKPQAT